MAGVSALERLMFTVGMTDNVSRPLANINRTLAGVRQNANAGFDAIRGGAVGAGASFLSIQALMQPVYDMDNALGEVRSLGTAEKELQTLKKTALDFSIQYGKSAVDFVKSSYDIQSAIGGLTNGELAKFTEASNLLAAATKADAATITGYMGTMYGIFQDQAAKMGKAEWVEMLTGQTAAAVQMFKTTGQEMSAAFTSLGANAQSAGIQLSEQMAILGTLQATMSGSEAGTKYKAFLAGVGMAQDKLGLSFTDSNGRLLPMLDILEKLKGKFGDTLSVAESDALKKAFGSDEAVSLIKLLMTQTDGLNKSITTLSRNTGMAKAEEMATAMLDPWEQFQAATEALRIEFGTALLPTVNSVLGTLTDGLTTVMTWTQEFPHLTKAIGLATLGVLLLGGAVGVMSIVIGIGRAVWAGMLAMLAFGRGVMFALTIATGLFTKGLAALRAIMLAITITVGVLTSPLWATVAVIGVIVAAVVAGIYYLGDWLGWWEKLGAWFSNTEWGAGLLEWIDETKTAISELIDSINILDGFSFDSLNPFSDSPDITSMNTAASNPPPVRESIREIMSGSGRASTYWGGVTINADGGMTPADLEQWAQLNGG